MITHVVVDINTYNTSGTNGSTVNFTSNSSMFCSILGGSSNIVPITETGDMSMMSAVVICSLDSDFGRS